MSAKVIAVGALSPFGRGLSAFDVTAIGEPAKVAIRRDDELVRLGFARPFAARVPDSALSTDAPSMVSADRAAHLLFDAFTDAIAELDRVRPAFRSERVGVVIGTSSGGMRSAEELFGKISRREPIPRNLAIASTYFAPFELVLREKELLTAAPRVQLVTACAASTWSIGMALRWLDAGEVDVAFAGGYDALGPFVAAGFESLRATTATLPSPFRTGRDGMALGEGAGVVAMVRDDDPITQSHHFFVTGFGASTDAVHITAPDRTGAGLACAAEAALADANVDPSCVEAVSAHGTSTPYNDSMEARAIARVFGGSNPVVHAFKAQIGHTLGAAGVLETLSIAHAMSERILPACAGAGDLDPDARVRLLGRAERATDRAAPCVLKESAAFGGANAALVLEATRPLNRVAAKRRPVYLRAAAHVAVADVELVARASGTPADRVVRMDDLSILGATSVARLRLPEDGDVSTLGIELAGSGIIVGHALATIDVNERFYARVLARGPTSAEPRVFPPTSPNLAPGQIAILFGLTGPSAAACGSLAGAMEAFDVAFDLVASGDTERMLVVALDLSGSAARALFEAGYPDSNPIADGAIAVLLDARSDGSVRPVLRSPLESRSISGHAGLAAWLGVPTGGRQAGSAS